MADAARLTERSDRTGSLTGVSVVSIHDPEQLRDDELSKKLLLVAAIRVSAVTLALGILFVLVQLDPPNGAREIRTWQYVLIGITYGLSIVYAAALRYRTLILPLAYVQIGLDALIVSVLVLMTGGVESIFGFAYVFPVLGGSVTLYRRGGLVAASVTILTYGAIVALQIGQLMPVLPTVRVASALLSFTLQSMGMAVVAILSSTLAEKVRVTGRALAEKQIDYEQLQELHAAILRSLPAGLITVDSTGTIRYANDAAVNILRAPLRSLLGQPLEIIVPSMRVAWERWRIDPSMVRERRETTYERPGGPRLRLGFSFAPLSLLGGRTAGSIVVFQDLTDIVLLKEAVERAERLATVGKFAAGLAHEVRNPLASMCASIDVLSTALDPPPEMRRLMVNVVNEADRLNRLISDFLVLSRPRTLQLARRDLGELVTNVIEVFRNDELLVGANLRTDLQSDVIAVVDEDLVRQVLWNLIKNAAEAIRDTGGSLVVEVREVDGHPTLAVVDDGPGISDAQLERVYDPFYTTKKGGSGLGLAISHSIVEAHGARMAVRSQEGEGTTVTIRFRPASEQAEIDTADLIGDSLRDDARLFSGSI